MSLHLDRALCGDLEVAGNREWLVTNGKGGYASGTVAGLLTRGYHGLLIAALKPPLAQTLMFVKLDETVQYGGATYELATNRWSGGTVAPSGYSLIESFVLEGTTPVWRFACGDALIEKRIWMEPGASTTYVRYTAVTATGPVTLTLKALVDYRSHHGRTSGDGWQMNVATIGGGVRVTAYSGAEPLTITASSGTVVPTAEWYRNFDLAEERERGLQDHEDHFHAATFSASVAPGQPLTIVATTEPAAGAGEDPLGRREAHEQALIKAWAATRQDGGTGAPDWVKQLVLSADQFIVDRPTPGEPDGKTVIAGYHWFGDWGRDTMISLPGLTLTTGRPDIARSILQTFARFTSQGMLPNRFPDADDPPEYNTVDATLWYFQAIRAWHETMADDAALRELFPVLADIIDWHRRGTRYNIHVDPADGLLYAGAPGVQLTWMDAKIGDWVVTPRTGKPVEINALWYNALCTMADFANRLGRPSTDYDRMADAALAGFARFWNSAKDYCFDVLDTDKGPDPTLRPNQILAVSLPRSPLSSIQQRSVVDACARALLTSAGLRSLDPADPAFCGIYCGDQNHRDSVYHQGTVWAWLKGPFIEAHLKAYGDRDRAWEFLDPMADLLNARGLGTTGEIYDGDPPFQPRGCIAQAWSVGTILHAWQAVQDFARVTA